MAKTSFLSDLVKTSGNDFASTIEEGIVSDVNGFVDTGSYAFNALLSGSLWGGIPDNKILALAGESATGKCARGRQKLVVYMKEEIAKKLGFE